MFIKKNCIDWNDINPMDKIQMWEDFRLGPQSSINLFGNRVGPIFKDLFNPTSGRNVSHSWLISLWPKDECTTTAHP